MAKLLIFLALFALLASTKAQNEAPANSDVAATTLSPEDEALQLNVIALAVIRGRIAAANLPPELEPAGQQILADASEGLELCADNLRNNHIIWQYKVCATAHLRNAIAAISALQAGSQQPPTSAA